MRAPGWNRLSAGIGFMESVWPAYAAHAACPRERVHMRNSGYAHESVSFCDGLTGQGDLVAGCAAEYAAVWIEIFATGAH